MHRDMRCVDVGSHWSYTGRKGGCLLWLLGWQVVWTRVPVAARTQRGMGLLEHDVGAVGGVLHEVGEVMWQ